MATAKELLLQEGHSKEVYSVEFQEDGALVASGYVHCACFGLVAILMLLAEAWTQLVVCGT